MRTDATGGGAQADGAAWRGELFVPQKRRSRPKGPAHMTLHELNAIETPSTASDLAYMAGAAALTVGIGLLFIS